MNIFKELLKEMGGFEELNKKLQEPQVSVQISGCIDSQKCHIAYPENSIGRNRQTYKG